MNKDLMKITELIKKHDKIALFHHIMIDGDSLTSSYGLLLALKSKFPNKTIKWLCDPTEVKKRFRDIDVTFEDAIQEIDESYLAIIGDCAGKERIKYFDQYEKAGAKIAYDHHQNSIDFDNDVFWHEPGYIASSLQATMIAEALEVKMDENIALHLLYGIITDSGRFSYSAADPLPLEVAARLMKFIENKTIIDLYGKMNRKTLKGLKFQGWVYEKLIIEERVGYVVIDKKDQAKLGMDADRVTRVNSIANIEDEKVWIFFVEYPDFTRVEFRSSGFPVNKVAMHFGGGGHIKASGCRLDDIAKYKEVIAHTKKELKVWLENN